MMHATVSATYSEVEGHRAVALPYASPNVRLILVLPPEGSFSDAIANFDQALAGRLVSELEDASVTLTMPKWSFEFEGKLKAPLRALGMHAAFDSSTADLSGMDGKPHHLVVDEVYHKAFIAVDEEGTEAAAATAVVVKTKSAHIAEPVTITFDRPFLFFVYDAPTGQTLFLGHLTDPS